MSAGNYGRTFAYASHALGMRNNLVLMPDTTPAYREQLVRKYGVAVKLMPSPQLLDGIRQFQQNGYTFMHPIDDQDLIAGYGTLGCEILKDVPQVDFILVCCGGGGLLAGVASYLSYFADKKVRIFGVEPETACGMMSSLQAGYAVECPGAKSIAHGLAPPLAGKAAFNHIQRFVEDILLVTDDDLKFAVKWAFNNGLVVEASGAASLAAFLTGKLEARVEPDALKGANVVIVVTGSNISPEELITLDV